MEEANLLVRRIKDGTVIDHIDGGKGLQVLEALDIDGKRGDVITIAPMGENIMRDGVSIVDTCKELEQRGGDVVGMNCFRGPATMMPYLKEIRKALKCHVAALPINYRTTKEHPTFL